MDRHDTKPKKKNFIKVVISFLLSGINIYLAVSLEEWTKEAPLAAIILFAAVGFAICWIITAYFLLIRERRLKTHALLWGILMSAAYVLGCRMRRDGTVLTNVSYFPALLAQIACLSVPAASLVSAVLDGDALAFLRLVLPGVKAGAGKMPGRSKPFVERTVEQADKAMEADTGGNVRKDLAGMPEQGLFSRRKKYRAWQAAVFYAAIIWVCWLPVFLAYYPSVFAYDAEGQLYQVIAQDYSTHHPLLHTLFLGAFFQLGGNVFGSYQTGMALHSVVQMTMMAAAFGCALAYLYGKGVSRGLRTMLLCFYALFPTNSVLAVSTTKDVLFAALVLLYTLSVYRMAEDADRAVYPVRALDKNAGAVLGGEMDADGNRCSVWQAASHILWGVLMLLFRNNAVYAFAVSVPLVYAGLYRLGRKGRQTEAAAAKAGQKEKELNNRICRVLCMGRRFLLCSAAALVLFGAGGAALKAATGAHNGSPREMLSVPLQQMARTRVKAEETLSPVMRRELDKYIPAQWVFAAYNPYLADPVKNRAVIHDDPVGLIKTWARLGIEHPQIYIDAFLDNSIGYWFIEDRTHAQIYGVGTESGFGYLSTDNRTMPAGCEIEEHSLLPGLRAAMERIVSDNVYQKVPVLRIIFAPAFYWWMLCLYIAVAVYRKRYGFLLPAVFLAVYYMTLLLSPTVLIRYMYPFVVTVPVICCCLFTDLENITTKIYNKN